MSLAAANDIDAAPHVHAEIARSLDDLLAISTLRAIVYMGEQNCPFEEEFDGNDLSGATHIIARIGREPVGICRVRWFAGFAKLERVAVSKRHRGAGIVQALWRVVAELASRKGYHTILGHAEAGLLPFWKRLAGFEPRENRPPFRFSGKEYCEGIAQLPPHPLALSLVTHPLVLLRPEGAWDEPGVLDQSSQRPLTLA